MLRTEHREERIILPREVRQKVLRDNYKVCAHCGKPLTEKTMTLEHIIPLSRGGKNEEANYCCLCPPCNKRKRNLFFLPYGYYHAIIETPRFKEILAYVKSWYQDLPETEKADLTKYPLLSPAYTIRLSINANGRGGDFQGHKKRTPIRMGTQELEWALAHSVHKQNLEHQTGMTVKEIRDWFKDYAGKNTGVYCLRKPTSGKILMTAGVRFLEERNSFLVYIPWTNLSKYLAAQVIDTLLSGLMYALHTVAQKTIHFYQVETPIQGILDQVTNVGVGEGLTARSSHGYYTEKETGKTAWYAMKVQCGVCLDGFRPNERGRKK